MWYVHQIFSGPFVIGVAGNIAAAILGFVIGIAAAHRLYDLRAIHKAIREHTDKHRGLLPNRYTRLSSLMVGLTKGQPERTRRE